MHTYSMDPTNEIIALWIANGALSGAIILLTIHALNTRRKLTRLGQHLRHTSGALVDLGLDVEEIQENQAR